MINIKAALVSAGLILAMVASALWVWMQLPATAEIAVHFGASGEADGWAHPWPGLFMVPGAGVLVWLLMAALPYIDPKGANLARSANAYFTIWVGIIAVLTAAQAAIVAASLGIGVNTTRLITAAVGALFIAIGNVFGKLRWNTTAGIRTPWTLADERVWDKTHRFGGRVFVAGGVIMLVAALVLPTNDRLVALIAIVVLGSVALTIVKSYLIWRHRQRDK
jgi:uncharacterized membrane protein